jgi:hypothetical protein
MALSASQRIKLIKEIADRLANEDWALIDLTLSQFGFPTSSTWSGGIHTYVLEHVGVGEDARLAELAEHLGYTVEQTGTSSIADPAFWKPGCLRVFLSHLSAHRAFTAELQSALLEYGITSFVAHNDIEPTLEWQTEIETALRTCHALVALLHQNFHASNWTDQEIGYVMGRGLPAFSIRLGQDPYGFIGRFQGFNGNGKSAAQLATELFNAYRSNKQTREQLAHGVVATFESSDSFALAKRNVGLLEALEYWEPAFSTRIQKAAENNGQIQSSWGVPERVAALVGKWAAA